MTFFKLISFSFFFYPPIFGLDDDFVAAALPDLNLDVGLFLIRYPGSLLTLECRKRV